MLYFSKTISSKFYFTNSSTSSIFLFTVIFSKYSLFYSKALNVREFFYIKSNSYMPKLEFLITLFSLNILFYWAFDDIRIQLSTFNVFTSLPIRWRNHFNHPMILRIFFFQINHIFLKVFYKVYKSLF